jgi:predicted adenylyl cyclase CyaB
MSPASRSGMARNVEIKASVSDLTPITAALAALAPGAPTRLLQVDTFFRCTRGRCKLRRFSAVAGELIHYERPDDPGPKASSYLLVPTTEPDRLRDLLAAAYGEIGIVRKHRTVWLVGRTRVHLDEVEGLGTFVELEVVLDDAEPAEQGVAEAHRLMAALGIGREQLVAGAYIDLLQAGAASAR